MPQDTVHRLRIELRHIQPKVWRRIEVPSTYTFWDLHSAIQDAMGWMDSHLHEFRIGRRGREITIGTEAEEEAAGSEPTESFSFDSGPSRLPKLESVADFRKFEAALARQLMSRVKEEMEASDRRLLEWETPIADHLAKKGDKADYTYDFGDDWEHRVSVVAIAPRAPGTVYPVCVDGRRACPPEDCGGPWNYADFLAVLADPKHEDHEEQLDWVGGSFDPERFDKAAVHFRNPAERLQAWRDFGRL